MLVIPGQAGRATCDGMTRRELLRVGGSALLGISLADVFALQARAKKQAGGGPGFGKAKSVILLYLQGGPSHLDLWDPKDNVPANVKSVFKAIDTKVPGCKFTELMPKFAGVNDKVTLIRSMSYTPVGLFNHTAAIYQMLTGYTADKVSPSGQLEPPSPKDFPTVGSNIIRLKPPTVPMLPFVMLPRPLQESGVVGKGGSAGFLGRAFDPYTLYPPGDDMDMKKMERIKVDDLKLRPEVSSGRLARRARLRDLISEGMPALEKATAKYDLDKYYGKALGLVLSGRARNAFDLSKEKKEMREKYGQWSRPSSLFSLPEVLTPRCGLRPNSPTATTSVSSSRPRWARSAISADSPASSIGPAWSFMRLVRPTWTSKEWLSELATLGQLTSTKRVPASISRRASRQLCPKVFLP